MHPQSVFAEGSEFFGTPLVGVSTHLEVLNRPKISGFFSSFFFSTNTSSEKQMKALWEASVFAFQCAATQLQLGRCF